MHTCIAFLRAVNMAGHNSLRMKDIASLFTRLGFTGVKTYIQSGNIVFRTNESKDYSAVIKEEIHKSSGFDIEVMIRTAGELRSVISRNPFRDPGKFDLSRVAVQFLAQEPGEEIKKKMAEFDFSPDKFLISDKEVFIFCPNGFGRSKLTSGFFEKKMGIKCTARNLNTVNAILGIAEKL